MSVASDSGPGSPAVALTGSWPGRVRDTVVCAVAVAPLVLLAVVLADAPDGWLALLPLGALTAVGVLLVGRSTSATVGALLLAVAVCTDLALVGGTAGRAAGASPWVPWWAWLGTWAWWPAATAAVCLLLVFPGGSAGRRTRVLVAAAVGLGALATLGSALTAGTLDGFTVANPVVAVPGTPAARAVVDVATTLLLGLGAIGLGTLLVRWQRATGPTRHQLAWVVAGMGLFALTGAFAMVSPRATNELSFVLLMLGVTAVPVTIGVAVLRHGMFDVEALLHRALIWIGVLAVLAACYGLVLVTVGRLLATAAGVGATLFATVAVALLVTPVRDGARRAADRVVYGVRRDPVKALDAVLDAVSAASVDGTGVPQAVVDVLVERLRIRHAAVELAGPRGSRTVARAGAPVDDPVAISLGEAGRLLVGPADDLSDSDRRLLVALARPLAAELRGARLALELQQARETLLLAREEERRALQQDLHDGVGPRIAGLTLGLDTVAALLPHDVEGASGMVRRIRDRSEAALDEVRRVAAGLGPPSLERGELCAALRLLADDVLDDRASLDVDPRVDQLPAAVQLGLYHVAAEAMSNAVRHGRAARVRLIVVRTGDEVTLTVGDDGRGVGVNPRPGTGLRSMESRCTELGGTLDVRAQPGGGTVVTARVPVS